ncbi:hypothetical protein JCGZ_19238 [Jatropha curcas]|uniref:Protein kinase domain-containing protein n=1 Tax=Jatropha curcas TaxID=180498 RepID=A0A067KB78_JATCU|nr:hypothetical protein JCGZ_19238 [Jatropha curcas]
MEPSSFYSLIICFFLFLIQQPSNCQQQYLSNQTTPGTDYKGYLCNGSKLSCQSFVTFLSRPPYDSPVNISSLLGSEAQSISLINNGISSTEKFPSEKLVMVPISCSCTGTLYQHSTFYSLRSGDNFSKIGNYDYQGLATWEAIDSQNYYDGAALRVGDPVMVPIRCACPSSNQTANGVIALLMYMVRDGDSVASIGKIFGVDEASILEANVLSKNSPIYPFTPILVPLKSQSCKANPGQFFCHCLLYDSLANENVQGLNCKKDSRKFPLKLLIVLGIGIGIGLLWLFLFVFKSYQFLKRRRYIRHKKKLFEQNGGLLLQQRLASCGVGEKAKLFTAEDLQRATDNYNQSRFLGQGGFGTVYKGMLPDGSIIAVKRSKTIDRSQIDQFINEVVILSQINHRNIVKLLGCCLETEFPLLVYEFISNGTLSHHIHKENTESLISWEDRCRIASEVAGAVAYMHSAASFPIFHRDIKSSNILLDDKYSAKVSDFGTSRSISYDKTHITTIVQGTFGYLDPEYFYTSQFTEKSDVYSFGVVLIELLTGEKPISSTRAEDERNLVAHFISSAEKDRLFQLLEPIVAIEARKQDIKAIAKLAMRCLSSNGKKRPTMKEVAMELDELRKSQTSIEMSRELSLSDEASSIVYAFGETAEEEYTEMETLSI